MNIVDKISVIYIFMKKKTFTITSITYYLHFRKSGSENVR